MHKQKIAAEIIIMKIMITIMADIQILNYYGWKIEFNKVKSFLLNPKCEFRQDCIILCSLKTILFRDFIKIVKLNIN